MEQQEVGYKPGCMMREEGVRHALSSCTYADDLNVLASSHKDLERQAEKISRYAEWANMKVNLNNND